MPVHANITAYKGVLVCELLARQTIANEVTTSLDRPGNLGQVIHNTKTNLGVSTEALELLKIVKKGRDSLGDIDWFESYNEQNTSGNFAWLGGPYAIFDPMTIEGSRDYKILDFVAIPNNVPNGAKEAIDARIGGAN